MANARRGGSGELRIAGRLDLDEIAPFVDAHQPRPVRPASCARDETAGCPGACSQDHAGTDDADVGQPLRDTDALDP